MIEVALVMGLGGSLHCAAMCGPLMLGLGTRNYSWFAYLVHHIGRFVGYLILGTLFYALVSPLYLFSLQQYVGLISGAFLILFGLKSYIGPLGQLLGKLSQYLSQRMSNGRYARSGNLMMGVLNGLLPCGLSFAAAGASVNAGSWEGVLIFMLVFGVGTLPMLYGITILPKLGKWDLVRIINAWIPKLLVIAGLLLILRSAGLGIPYVSPVMDQHQQQVDCCEPHSEKDHSSPE